MLIDRHAIPAPFHDVPVPFSVEQNILREPQASRCMSNGYKHDDIYRCVSCTRRWAGDTCRFQNIRSFCRDSDGRLIAYTFQEQPTPSPALNYPNEWNIPLEKSHIDETKKIIALALLPILHEELQHITLPRVIFRPRESEVRATCDTCLTSIFSCSWMCRICGRESCGECFEHVKNLTIEPTGSPSKIEELRARRDKHAHAFPSFLNCMKRAEHGAKDFLPVTRFIKQELAEAVGDMEQFLRRESISVEQPAATSRSQPSVTTSSDQGSTSNSSGPRTPPDMAMSPLSSDSEATLVAASYPADLQPTIASGSVEEIPSHEIQRFQDSELTEEVFRPIWRKGDPILVTDVGRKLKIKWSPQYFMEKYGTQSCLIIDCQAEILNKRITVAEFFSTFGIYEDRDQCWKLKDWPPSSDFKSEFPELYQDFSEAVPIPNYVRRDGALNIASHFPSNTVGPDLGPKMYNAYANQDDSGKGSTRLHMDMADALNIMTFAAIGPDGQPGRAAWDLFCAQDSDKIRKFLHGKYPELKGQDPIHRQTVYLDDVARRELWQEYGVKSYRVYQMAGEAVFIPAGCAHQVRNLSDCIKVAIDFVSPENIERCEKLTREFRALAWKEDVLQLRTMMWFAWLSCCRQEKLAAEEAS
ncbi:Clavaminate synthase-like protein [Mycena crocata]|nr:Clavaminate synthase-like protein [Mycena crocata]